MDVNLTRGLEVNRVMEPEPKPLTIAVIMCQLRRPTPVPDQTKNNGFKQAAVRK